MTTTVSVRWRYTFRANAAPRGWRDRVGDFLRRLAGRVDRRVSVAFEMTTSPALTTKRKSDCFKKGIQVIEDSIISELKEASVEVAMRAHCPELYEQE